MRLDSNHLVENAVTDPSGPCSDEPQPEEVTQLGLSLETGSREGVEGGLEVTMKLHLSTFN